MKKPYVMCAAIHFQDGNTYLHQPLNIVTGIVICGRTHASCYVCLASGFQHYKIKKVEGFLTSNNRFVSRLEASQIALDAGQIEAIPIRVFTSEDLF